VPLVPVIGISDADGKLLTYLPYRKVDYTHRIKANIMLALGDVDAEGMNAMLESSGRVRDSDDAKPSRPPGTERRPLPIGRSRRDGPAPSRAFGLSIGNC